MPPVTTSLAPVIAALDSKESDVTKVIQMAESPGRGLWIGPHGGGQQEWGGLQRGRQRLRVLERQMERLPCVHPWLASFQ